uniref:Uncharacterized protein n=1 Tax=Anguilla anguilla TaxID=7936 RepID=A0A0E9SXE6_ANGAN
MRRYGTRTLSRVLRGSERVRVCVCVCPEVACRFTNYIGRLTG